MLSRTILWLMCLLWCLTGCLNLAHRSPLSPEERERADLLAAKLERLNIGLSSCKGKGRIVFSDGRFTQSARIFWIGDINAGLRLQTLDIAGRPSLSLASDKRCFYYLSHLDDRFQRHCTRDPSLASLLAVPLRFSDVEPLFYGKLPVKKHHQTFYERDGNTHVLRLESRWGRCLQKITFSPDMEHIQSAINYGSDGQPLYEIEFINMKIIDGYQIPFGFMVTGENQAGFKLTVDQFIPNADVTNATFVLKSRAASER